MIKKYLNFLNEASIKQSLPQEYLSKIEREEGMRSDDSGGRMSELMSLSNMEKELSRGKEKQLEDLAKEIITLLNSDLLRLLKVNLDISLVTQSEIGDEVENAKSKIKQSESERLMSPKIGDDINIQEEIQKRDIANLIIQGEAKQIKDILLKDETTKDIVKSRIDEIYGPQSNQIMNIWTRMLDILELKDKTMNTETMGMMISNLPSGGLAGFTYVEWEEKEQEYTEEEPEEYQPWTGEESEEDYYEDEPVEPSDKVSTPTIYAVGIDFPMLLHETQKGIYEFLALPGLPEDDDTLKIVKANTGPMFEPEGWKYGPRVVKDLREYFSRRLGFLIEKNGAEGNSDKNERISEMVNLRQFFFRELLNKETMPTKDFLNVMKGILLKMTNKSTYTDEEQGLIDSANSKCDSIIDQLVEKLDYEYKKLKYEEDLKRYEQEMKDYERKMKEWESSQKQTPSTSSVQQKTESEKERLQRQLREAEQEEDYELAAQLRDQLKNLS
jgi:protein-arginine kinase activator protein McsA